MVSEGIQISLWPMTHTSLYELLQWQVALYTKKKVQRFNFPYFELFCWIYIMFTFSAAIYLFSVFTSKTDK